MKKNTTLPTSILTKSQKKQIVKHFKEDDKDYTLFIKLIYDDECGNKHNTFSITGSLYEGTHNFAPISDRYLLACGCLHDEIAKYAPELEYLVKWHLVSTDGPLHYLANTLYHAKKRDFEAARNTAVWPEATDEQLSLPSEDLKKLLLERLPALMQDFKLDMEKLGFTY